MRERSQNDSVSRIISTLREENLILSQKVADLTQGVRGTSETEALLREENSRLQSQLNAYESILPSKQHSRSHDLSRVIDLRNSLAREYDDWRVNEQRDIEYGILMESEANARKIQLDMTEQIEKIQYEDSKKAKIIDVLRKSLMEKESKILELTRQVDLMNDETRLVNHIDLSDNETNPRLILASSEIVALKEEKSILLQRFGALEEVLASKDAEIAGLRLRLGEVDESRRRDRRQQDLELRTLREELARLEQTNAELKLSLSRHEMKLEQEVEVARNEAEGREQELKRQIEIERKRNQDLKYELQAAAKEEEAQREEIRALEEELKQKQERIIELTELAVSLDSDLQAKNIDPTVQCLQSHMQELQEELKAKNLQLLEQARLQAKIRHLRDENRSIQGNLNQMDLRNRLLTRSCNELKYRSLSVSDNASKDELTLVQQLLLKSYPGCYNSKDETLELRSSNGLVHVLEIVPNGDNGLRERFLYKDDEVVVIISNGRCFAEARGRHDGEQHLVDLMKYLDSRATKNVRFTPTSQTSSSLPPQLSEGTPGRRLGVPQPALYSYTTSLPAPSASMLSQLPIRSQPLSR